MPRKVTTKSTNSPTSKLSAKPSPKPKTTDTSTNLIEPTSATNLIVPPENIVSPMIEQPLDHISDMVRDAACTIQMQEIRTVEVDKATSTRTLSITKPAKVSLPTVGYRMLALILGVCAIIGTVIVLIF